MELVRRSFGLANAGELDAAMQFLSPDVEWVVAREHPEARTVVGLRAVAEYFRTWEETMPNLSLKLDRVLDGGEKVVSTGWVTGVGTGSGAEVEVPIAFVYTFRHGLVVRVEEYLNPHEALKAVGLEE